MTISRGQMNRQLYMGGGIMNAMPREQFGIGSSLKKLGKKAVGAVKDIASSDLGKAALLYAGTAGLGALGAGAARTSTGFGGIFNPTNVLGNLAASGRNLGILKSIPDYGNVAQRSGPLAKFFDKPLSSLASVEPGGGHKGTGLGIICKLATLGVVSTFLTKTLGMPPEQAEEEVARDPSKYLELYYRNLNPPTADTNSEEYEAQVRDFVTTNTSEYAVGGRVGFDEGSPRFNIDDINFDAMQDIMPKLELEDDISIPMPKVEEDDILIPGPDGEIKVKPLKGIENLQASIQYELPFGEPLFVVKQAGKFFGVFEQKDGSRILLPMDKSGSRLNLANAGPVLPPDTTQPVNPFGPKPGDFGIEEDIPIKMASNEISIDKIEMLIKRGADNDLIKEFTGASDGVIDQIRDAMKRKNKAGGGIMNRMNYALGDTASQNAMQAAGIEGLPIRQNPKGVKELDLRDNGGFIPPVGIKEKEDDIPAMLSNNEFVFTADAVRGMGDGDVELGAQRMYDQMKMLEKGGRV